MQFVESASASLLLGLRSWATIPGLILSFKEQKSMFFFFFNISQMPFADI